MPEFSPGLLNFRTANDRFAMPSASGRRSRIPAGRSRREADITFAAVNVVVGPQAIAAGTRRNASVVTIGADSLTVR